MIRLPPRPLTEVGAPHQYPLGKLAMLPSLYTDVRSLLMVLLGSKGPVVDFRVSTDKGKTWKEDRVNATSGSDNLFGETAANNTRVKFGA